MGSWKRVSVDLDGAGNVRGVSVEWHHDDECETLTVVAQDPFVTPQEALRDAMALLPRRGDQLSLL